VLWIPIRIDFGLLVLDPGSKWTKITRKKRKLEKLSLNMPDFLFGVQGPYSDPDPELDTH
jgi:hypothetical protein